MFGLRGVILESDPWKGNPKTGKRVEGERSIVAGKRGEAKPVGAVEGEELGGFTNPVSPEEHHKAKGELRAAQEKQAADLRGGVVGRVNAEFLTFLDRCAGEVRWNVEKFRFGGTRISVNSLPLSFRSYQTTNNFFLTLSNQASKKSCVIYVKFAPNTSLHSMSFSIVVRIGGKMIVTAGSEWVRDYPGKVVVVDDKVMSYLRSGDHVVWDVSCKSGGVDSFSVKGGCDKLVSSFIRLFGDKFGESRRIGWDEGREPGDIAGLISEDVGVNNGLIINEGMEESEGSGQLSHESVHWHDRIIERLAVVCDTLARNNIPAAIYNRQNAHWSGTKSYMEEILDRALTQEEITVLSLGREYGPTPALNQQYADKLMRALWPEGNHRGLYYEWADLANALRKITREVPIGARTYMI